MMAPTPVMIKAAAEALAKARAERGRGPVVSKTLDALPYDQRRTLTEDAQAALEAALKVAPWSEVTLPPQEELRGLDGH